MNWVKYRLKDRDVKKKQKVTAPFVILDRYPVLGHTVVTAVSTRPIQICRLVLDIWYFFRLLICPSFHVRNRRYILLE